MQRIRSVLLVTMFLALVASPAVLLPRIAEAQSTSSDDLRCRGTLADDSRRYAERLLAARLRCQNGVFAGSVAPGTNCITGSSDERLARVLRVGEEKLRRSISAACSGVNLKLLGFPGVCTDSTGGAFDLNDLAQCILDGTHSVNTSVLNVWYPPPTGGFRGPQISCIQGAARDAYASYRRGIRFRQRCLLDREAGRLPESVICRGDIQPYGPGTGDASVDREISKSYLTLLTGLPLACAQIQIEELGYENRCPRPGNGRFSIFDLKNCLFNENRAQTPNFLNIVFPTDPVCGNARVETGEECDLGIANNSDTKPDTCRSDCTNPSCPDGVKDRGEGCDDGNAVSLDGCTAACVDEFCGDDIVNDAKREQCDDGKLNSDTRADACRKNCRNASCGDGARDTGEACDDGNKVSGDGCTATCVDEFCGDDVVNDAGKEQCDDGDGNSDTEPDACRKNCKDASCGDNVVDPGANEECDLGQAGNSDTVPDTCRKTCRNASCGDKVIDTGEQCDLGTAANSDTKPNTCRTDCRSPFCQDGVRDSGEGCDDGNSVDLDGCTAACVDEFCGDEILNDGGVEQCDDGSANSDTAPDACRKNCLNAACGDGAVDSGEECDDDNQVSGDGCTATCVVEFCGDGVVQAGIGEECDDRDQNSDTAPDACRENCRNASCGDEVLDSGEECDTDGSPCGSGNGCQSNCECAPACPGYGELVLYSGVGEECETGADCPVGDCDPDLGRCRTVSRLDSGWTGLGHAADINNVVRTRGFLANCEGNGPCGQCEVIGVDPSTRACRCANDTRTVCDTPFGADLDDCGMVCVGGGSRNNRDCTTNGECVQVGVCNRNAKKCNTAPSQDCLTNADCPNLTGTCSAIETCECHFGSPFPLSSGGTPVCIANRFAENITGTSNVDLGESLIRANLRTKVFQGETTSMPCPVCGGRCGDDQGPLCIRDEDCDIGVSCILDPVADDGIRGGFCLLGDDDGLSCDVTGVNTSFPAFNTGKGGAGHSLDCYPGVGKNISGAGIRIFLNQTTGTATLRSQVSCLGNNPDLLCPCLMCSGDPTVPCNSDAECAGQEGLCSLSNGNVKCTSVSQCSNANAGVCDTAGKCSLATSLDCGTNSDCASRQLGVCTPSTCSVAGGSAGFPRPNDCDLLLCTDHGDGTGRCTLGPESTSCDGLVTAAGRGILSCSTNEDCAEVNTGQPGGAGACTLAERLPCLPDPIVATGKADPSTAIGAAAFCVGPTGNDAINGVAGLPGPARVVTQTSSRTFCERDPGRRYVPGVGGCLD